jgi:hypothetical protein
MNWMSSASIYIQLPEICPNFLEISNGRSAGVAARKSSTNGKAEAWVLLLKIKWRVSWGKIGNINSRLSRRKR